jgi:hypothetical protein
MLKKILLILVAVAFMVTPAFAGNRPEFDAVGDDSANVFNDAIKQFVVANAFDGFGNLNNHFSNFPQEFFQTQAGALQPDPCFFFFPVPYLSALTDAYNEGVYRWRIVLQMKPETDLDLNIVDCVLKHNSFDILTAADQTGRYRAPWGQLFFVPSANPKVTVRALPGRYATPGFPAGGFFMDARQIPGLAPVSLNDVYYTTKAFWEEAIVMVLPATGTTNTAGQAVYNLKQGDQMDVTVTIPFNNTVDVRYGKDNVVLKYVGIIGTEYDTLIQ